MNTLHVKKGSNVIVLSGKDKGKKGKVISVDPSSKKVVVEGINVVSKHLKPKKQGNSGGIVKKEAPIYASKVSNVCGKCSKPTRVAHKFDSNGKKSAICKHCGAEL